MTATQTPSVLAPMLLARPPAPLRRRLRAMFSLAAVVVCGCSTETSEQSRMPPKSAPEPEARTTASAGESRSAVERGRLIAAQWCASCHLLPDPSDLPRERWALMIRWMGNYLGHPDSADDIKNLIYPTLVATEASITRAELDAIKTYYETEAPLKISPAFDPERSLPVTPLFTPEAWPGYRELQTIPLVKIDAERRQLYLGSASDSFLRLFAADGTPISRINCSNNQAIDVRPRNDGFDLVLMGELNRDVRQGTVHAVFRTDDASRPLRASRIVSGFFRTSGAAWGDLNGDGREDVVLAGFGDYAQGALSWFSAEPGQEAQRHDLRVGSGALDAVVDDVDGDGDLDVLSIVAQGHQEMWWYENDGSGQFTPHRLWKERSAVGYNGFQWTDFNGDGKRDIVVAAGNNMEMVDPPLKSLHGVYVYLQTEPMTFQQAHFLRMDGVVKALATDYDGDGDQDVAAVSAYPDWNAREPVVFALFTRERDGTFSASTISAEYSGQPITMDAGDLDGDGDVDLVLGGASWAPNLHEPLRTEASKRIARAPSVVFLRNRLRDPAE